MSGFLDVVVERGAGVLGVFAFIGLCWLLSNNRKAVAWKPVVGGIGLQILLALFILKTELGTRVFASAQTFFEGLISFSTEGGAFVFGPLMNMELTGEVFGPSNAFIFAIQVSATIIFVSSLMAVLYYVRVMEWVVGGFARVMQLIMGTSGAESLSTAANVFMGQTEAPLVVRPYLDKMTRSELMALMTGGMATVAGGVLAAYVGFGVDAGHLLAASVMSAPATLAIAKVLMPETEHSETRGKVRQHRVMGDANVLDAACRGAGEGLQVSLNVMAMLIAFIALIAFMNAGLEHVGEWIGMEHPLTVEYLLGLLFSPLAWLMGVPPHEIAQVGSLLGVKTVLNEFVAYLQLVETDLSPRSTVIATYALCGFANFSSVAIQIGGIGALIPKRRKELARIGFMAMVGGTVASFMTATIAGILL